MKKIGSGWTYNVYEYKDGMVIKKKRPFWQRALRIIISDPRLIFRVRKTIKSLDTLNNQSFTILKKLEKTNFDFSTIGNPVFVDKDTYIQNRFILVKDFLRDQVKLEKFVEEYIEQIKYFWSYGFADIVFNFTINNGISEIGEIVLFDFNEITDDKELVLRTIQKHKWVNQHSVKFHLRNEQRSYFKNKMSEEITAENLELLWNKNSQ